MWTSNKKTIETFLQNCEYNQWTKSFLDSEIILQTCLNNINNIILYWHFTGLIDRCNKSFLQKKKKIKEAKTDESWFKMLDICAHLCLVKHCTLRLICSLLFSLWANLCAERWRKAVETAHCKNNFTFKRFICSALHLLLCSLLFSPPSSDAPCQMYAELGLKQGTDSMVACNIG